MREDIYGGLKNAMQRGYSLEQAIQSFINSGYSESEVKEAAAELSGVGAMSVARPSLSIQESSKSPNQYSELGVPIASQPIQEPSKKGKGKITVLIVLLVIVGILGLSILLFKESLAEFFDKLVG